MGTLDYHRGCFPVKPAKHLFGDRYVTIGDAAGLIRPFKGKGQCGMPDGYQSG